MKDLKKKLEFVAEVVRKAEYELSQELDTHCDEELYAYNEALVEDLQKVSGLLEEVKVPKVYVLFTEDVIDFDPYRSIEVFSSKEKAMEAFDDYCQTVSGNIKEKNWEIECNEGTFEAYESYSYAENRVYAKVYELEVK